MDVLRQILKWTGIVLGSLIVLVIIAAGAFYFLFDWNWLKGSAIERLSDATGRKIEIAGNIQGEFALVPRITVEGIRIANADWAKEPYLADIQSMNFRIKLLDLLRGRVTLTDLSIDQADIRLEKNPDGQANWDLGADVASGAVEATVPEDRQEFPVIGKLSIDNSQLIYNDSENDLMIKSAVSLAEGTGGTGTEEIHLAGTGTYQGRPVKLEFRGASILHLRESNDPYPLFLRLDVGNTHIGVDGIINDPLNPEHFDVKMDLAGKNLADLYLIFRVPLPPTSDYQLSGQLNRDGEEWRFSGMKGRVGNSDLSGNVTVDTKGERPFMEASLVSTNLDFDDLGGFIGAPPGRDVKTKGEPAAQDLPDAPEPASDPVQSQRLLPAVPINLERLQAMDMRVRFEGKSIKAPDLPIDNLQTNLVLDNGLLKLDPLAFGVAGGTIKGPLILNGRESIPRVDANLTLTSIGLKQFFQKTEMADVTEGKIGGTIKLAGRGRSLADVLGSSAGRVTLAMTGGKLDPLAIELMGLDIGQALLVIADPPQSVTIRCALADLEVQNGQAAINGFVVDTTDSNIWATGEIDLKNESLDVVVNADPKDASLLSANAPIAINGSFAQFTIAVDPTDTSDEGGLAEALGTIVNPIIALLPFVDLGLGEDTDCRRFEPGSGKPVPEKQDTSPN